MTDTLLRLAGTLRIGNHGDSDDVLFCGDVIVAEWAQEHIGGGDPVVAHIWGPNAYFTAEEAGRMTRECPSNRWVSLRYWTSDKQESDEAIKQRALESLYGALDVAWGARYSEITGYLWTDEDFHVGGHDMIWRLSCDVGKYLLLEVIVHDAPPTS